MMAGSWFSNPPDLEGIHSLKIPPHEDFHQNLWQAERVAILAIGESPHESGRKPRSLAQIRTL
ncbi:MAG: hypothetical protein WCK17_14025, partial [Verrucomicrobiota bacterium]